MRFFLVILALFGLYSQIPVSIGEQFIPNIIGLAAGFILLGLNFKQLRKSHIRAMLGIIAVVILGFLLSPSVTTYLPNRISALAQLTISFIAGYGLYLEFRKFPYQKAMKILVGFCVFIIFGSILEVLTPLRSVITAFTDMIWLYDFENQFIRDLKIAGFARPVFLTSEPSYVAQGVVVFSAAAMILNPSRRAAIWMASALFVGVVFVRSPTVVVGLPMLFSIYAMAHRKIMPTRERKKRNLRTVYLGLLIGLPAIVAVFTLFADRLMDIQGGSDISTIIRLVSALKVGFEGALQYPIAGVGLGGSKAVEDLIIDTMIDSGVPAITAYENWDEKLNNGIGTHLLYFGFFLLPLFLGLFYRLLSRLSDGNGMLIIVLMLFLCLTTGNIYSPKFVIYYFLFSAAAHIAFVRQNVAVSASISK